MTGDPLAPGASEAAATRAVLALSFGLQPSIERGAWPAVLAMAEREGCAPVCWHRAGATIRAEAPAEVRDGFRARAIAVATRAERQLAALADVLATLEGANVTPVVLKGMPLAQLAHGDPFVRQSSDIDLLVVPSERGRVAQALQAAGWRCEPGESVTEDSWLKRVRGAVQHVEVQTALLGDMLAHLEPRDVPTSRLTVGGVDMTVLAPEALPVHLSVHLARHRLVPLLWFVDLDAVWQALSESQRAAARDFARAHGLHRYLAWGLGRANAARRVAEGLDEPLASLGVTSPRGRSIGHPAARDFRLAPDARALAHVASAWMVPGRVRADGGALRGSARRLARLLRRAVGAIASGGAPEPAARAPIVDVAPPARPLAVDRDDLEVVLRAVVAEPGGSMWLRARGRSMHPTIRDGALVRLVPVGDAEMRAGQVVLARLGDGSWALHRVVRETAAGVELQGDATVAPDPVVPRQAVLAAADAVAGPGGQPEPIPARAPWTLVRVTRRARLAWWRVRGRLRARTRARSGAACPT